MAAPPHHIFLSHAGADTQPARQLAEILRRHDLDIWFDKDNLQSGDSWQAALENAISQASAMVVYIGSLGIQTWVDREVRFGLVRNTANRQAFPFIPVLGEGADLAKLPPFVQQHQCVDLRDPQTAPEQIRRLIDVLRNASPQAAIPAEYWTTHTPFRSLQTFAPEDSWLFFGRDAETAELLTRLRRARVLAVIGNSGSGKSSLIQAGLIPSLRRGRFRQNGATVASWRIAVFRPSASPFDYLAEALPGQLAPELSPAARAELTDHCWKKLPEGGAALRNATAALAGPTDHVLLVADQFEELFTLVEDPAIRRRYIECLLAAARLDAAVPVHLVLALRADFYANCLNHTELSACLDTNLYNVPLMSPPRLREAIESRLALAGARAEPGLMDSLLADVGAEPGNLALLEHALSQLWEKSGGAGGTLTGDAYTQIGRLRGALGRHADEVYQGLGETEQPLAQRIFLELVQLGEGAQDTRRRVAKETLLQIGNREQVERLIANLASKRLLATSATFVEVSHEALIREWPMLREWLKDNRDDLHLERTLLRAADEWSDLKREPGALMRGARLAQGKEWLAAHPAPTPLLREYIEASCDAEEEAARQDREAQQELLRQAEARAEAEQQLRAAEETTAVQARRSATRSRRLSYALGVLLLVAVGLALFALQELLKSWHAWPPW